jgi:hypothetical protein
MIETHGMIERTRREVSELRDQITAALATLERSRRLLARPEPPVGEVGDRP